MNEIKFYSVADEYGEFSNFALYPITLKGKTWPTSEHYFQAQKFLDVGYQEKIRKTKSPMVAARLGRSRKQPIRKDWDKARNSVMALAIEAKFSQYESLKSLLLETDNAKLIEHTVNDSYWGDGGNGKGQNMLGTLLMKLREKIKE